MKKEDTMKRQFKIQNSVVFTIQQIVIQQILPFDSDIIQFTGRDVPDFSADIQNVGLCNERVNVKIQATNTHSIYFARFS